MLMVADIRMSLRSCRFSTSSRSTPSRKSPCMCRSWTSSTIRTSYQDNRGSVWSWRRSRPKRERSGREEGSRKGLDKMSFQFNTTWMDNCTIVPLCYFAWEHCTCRHEIQDKLCVYMHTINIQQYSHTFSEKENFRYRRFTGLKTNLQINMCV